ncbi:MAG: hypothetical protein WBP26_03300 [Candidatus Saccharimonadales bacterium]
MTQGFEGSPRPIDVATVNETFAAVTGVLRDVRGMEQLDALAAIAGGADSYNALIEGSETFLRNDSDVLSGRAPSPAVMGLWIGLVVGAASANKTNS